MPETSEVLISFHRPTIQLYFTKHVVAENTTNETK